MREQAKEVTERVKTLVCAKKTSARGKYVWDGRGGGVTILGGMFS